MATVKGLDVIADAVVNAVEVEVDDIVDDAVTTERERIAKFLQDQLGGHWDSVVEMRPMDVADLVRRVRTGDYR